MIHIQSTRACFALCVKCITLLHEYMHAFACPTSIPSVREPNNACCCWCMRTCGHVSAYGLLDGCANALLSMRVHAYCFSAIFNERWALLSFDDICGSACHCICGYTLTIPPLHTLPYYPRTKHPFFLVFGLIYRHTASNSITTEMHTSGAQ